MVACMSALVSLTSAVPFNLRFPESLGAWCEVAFSLMLAAASFAVAAHIWWARRVLVFLLWLAALFSASGLVFAGVMAWTTRGLPGLHGWGFLILVGTVYCTLGTALFGGLYLFFHSERVVQTYGA